MLSGMVNVEIWYQLAELPFVSSVYCTDLIYSLRTGEFCQLLLNFKNSTLSSSSVQDWCTT